LCVTSNRRIVSTSLGAAGVVCDAHWCSTAKNDNSLTPPSLWSTHSQTFGRQTKRTECGWSERGVTPRSSTRWKLGRAAAAPATYAPCVPDTKGQVRGFAGSGVQGAGGSYGGAPVRLGALREKFPGYPAGSKRFSLTATGDVLGLYHPSLTAAFRSRDHIDGTRSRKKAGSDGTLIGSQHSSRHCQPCLDSASLLHNAHAYSFFLTVIAFIHPIFNT